MGEAPIAVAGVDRDFQLNLDGQQVTQPHRASASGSRATAATRLREFEFVTNRFDATQGRSTGVQVNAITKSGTNTPAGTFSGYFRDDSFNADDQVANRVLPYSDQQLSGTFGGPIVQRPDPLLRQLRVRARAADVRLHHALSEFNGSLTGTRTEHKGIGRVDFQFSPQMRLSVRATAYDNRIPYDSRYTGGSTGRWHRRSARTAAASRCSPRSRRCWARRGQRNQGRPRLFHWNQFAHVKNPNTLPGMTPGFGAPNILLPRLHDGAEPRHHAAGHRRGPLPSEDDFTLSFNARGGTR